MVAGRRANWVSRLLVAAGERREMALRCVRNKGDKHPRASGTGKDHFFSLLAVAAAVA
jgi:hypothetical protein